MVFYFSGTGNSQRAAKQIAELLGDELVSINACLKRGEKEAFHSERPLVVVAPTYAWQMPKVVERWIRETEFEGTKDIYIVLTCGGSVGNAAAYAKKLCGERDCASRVWRWSPCRITMWRCPIRRIRRNARRSWKKPGSA